MGEKENVIKEEENWRRQERFPSKLADACSAIVSSIHFCSRIGANLKNLNLGGTRISSEEVGSLVGHVPNLENLS
ncbi:Leucine-rich repeat [Quillaja saponaria]|uniref:Leucine-rich repeat n=1 Tax=Quillaja saponaria TaxID=32244 RepID=A0AAD7PES1_QUISA|nr:Leucine-rich repeat [Quillaja saponaria]